MIEIPQCVWCSRLIEESMKSELKCEAFPDGIPEEIVNNSHDHHEPYPGDNDIQFEQVKEEVES